MRSLTSPVFLACAVFAASLGCSESDDPADTGPVGTDATVNRDAASADARVDAGTADSGAPDLGTPDTGVPDATPVDSGVADAGQVALESVAIEPPSFSVTIGGTQALVVRATYSDGTTPLLTAGLTFESSNQDVASVGNDGLVTGVAEGSATITVSVSSKTATASVMVAGSPAALFPQVFVDDFAAGVTFADFGGATNQLSVDSSEKHSGTASLRIEVPAAGYTGWAVVGAAAEDMSSFDALTFWAKASAPHTVNVTGLGNNASTSTFQAEWNGVPLTTSWQKFVIPVPLPSLLLAETGLFHLAEGSDEGAYTIWIDDLQYETLGGAVLGAAQPAIATETINRAVGDTHTVNGSSAVFPVNGTNQVISLARSWMTWSSSDEAVVTMSANGVATAVGPGTATINAHLGAIAANGVTTINVTAAIVPAVAAPSPTAAQADVISLFSNAYTNATVDTWSAGWDSADLTDVQVAGNDVKKFSSLVFAGIEFGSAPVDATAMTHFHMDIWTPDATTFGVKLVDFGAGGTYAGGDDTEHQINLDASTTPAIVGSSWVSIDLPLSAFTNLAARAHLAQMVIVANNSGTVYVDNVYFHR